MHLLFPGQQPDEKICLVTREHWFVLAQRIFVWLIFVVLFVLFNAWAAPNFPFLAEPPAAATVNLFKTIYLMLLVVGLFTVWILYYLNAQIITDQRIVDIAQKNVLFHTTSELNLGRVQDVTAEIKGVFGTFFNYGNVYVQTAGEQARFQFDRVPNPDRVAKQILDLFEALPPEKKVIHE